MRTIKLTLAYDGSAYKGFQKQPHGNTVQNVLEEFLSQVCGEPILTAGSGRTDAGVHALRQVVSFNTEGRIPCANILRAASSMLPEDMVLLAAEEAPADFHARYSAMWKQYCYHVVYNNVRDPFLTKYAWQIHELMDLESMHAAAQLLLGRHDFTAFRSRGSVENDPVRTIYRAEWKQINDKELRFYIAGDGFLYHMVRNLVWSLVQVGLRQRTQSEFAAELKSDRCTYLNAPAPAGGLYLDYVGYTSYTERAVEK